MRGKAVHTNRAICETTRMPALDFNDFGGMLYHIGGDGPAVDLSYLSAVHACLPVEMHRGTTPSRRRGAQRKD